MALEDLKTDLDSYLKSLQARVATTIDLKTELVDNIGPLFRALIEEAESIDDDVDALSESVDDLLAPAEDIIQPPTAALILSTLQAGSALADELDKIIASMKTDTPARASMKAKITALVKMYRDSVIATATIVARATVQEAPEDPAEAGAAVEDDEDDDDELDEDGNPVEVEGDEDDDGTDDQEEE